MTRLEFKQLFIKANGTDIGYRPAWLANREYYMSMSINDAIKVLAPFPTTTTTVRTKVPMPISMMDMVCNYHKQEGTIPMRYTDNSACATASVATPASDVSKQTSYLIERLSMLKYPKDRKLRDFFNFYVDNTPKTYKELIDVIKGDKFTLDAKIVARVDEVVADSDEDDCNCYGPFYGIIWNGPQTDRKGYTLAIEEMNKLFTATTDIIMGNVYADGLKAVQDFEAWMPTPTTATVQ